MKIFLCCILLSIVSLSFFSCLSSPNNTDDGGYSLETNYPCPYDTPAWSKDGGTILFHLNKIDTLSYSGYYNTNSDSSGIYRINTDGTGMQLLFNHRPSSIDFAPNNEWAVWAASGRVFRGGFANGKIKNDNMNLHHLTFKGSYPAVSPDNKWIAYSNNDKGGIWIMDINGGNKRIVINDAGSMDWYCDGNNLLHIGPRNEVFLTLISDTTDSQRLTSFNQPDFYASDNRYPKFSPDCRVIAFYHNKHGNGRPGQICRINSDGSNFTALTTYGGTKFDWSPDGKQIVYVRHNGWKFDRDNGTLWIMNADGSDKSQLTFNRDMVLKNSRGEVISE